MSFSPSRSFLHPLAWGPFPHPKAPAQHLQSDPNPVPPSDKDACDHARPPASPGSPLHLKIPNLTTSQSRGLGCAHLWDIIPPAAPRKGTAVGPLWVTHSVNASETWGHLEDSYWGLWGTSSSSQPCMLSPCGPWLLFWGPCGWGGAAGDPVHRLTPDRLGPGPG